MFLRRFRFWGDRCFFNLRRLAANGSLSDESEESDELEDELDELEELDEDV